MTWKSGVDVLCFGGTKNGIAIGEAVVFFNTELAREFGLSLQTRRPASVKMRFSFRAVGRAVGRMERGCAMPGTPTPWPAAWKRPLAICRE